VEACPEQAISFSAENGPATDVDQCQLCGGCVAVCLSSAKEIIGAEMTVAQVITEIEKDLTFYDESGGGVTFSGGEPLMQPQFLLALLSQCRTRKIHTAIDATCYAEPELVLHAARQCNLFLCDLKHTDASMHERFTGVDNRLILSNIRRLSEAGAEIIIRITIVPGFNDDPANIDKTADFAASLAIRSIDIRSYNSAGGEKADRLASNFEPMEAEALDDEKMNAIADLFRKRGFQVTTQPL
jgi:pyruvate formate lyase activating enzyme